jgi:predicted translation initiation factor SUI1
MPFTIGGDWIPEEEVQRAKQPTKPVKVYLEKRGKAMVTCIKNIRKDKAGLKELATTLKKKCCCGGTVKDDVIEIQGDHIAKIREELKNHGIKA